MWLYQWHYVWMRSIWKLSSICYNVNYWINLDMADAKICCVSRSGRRQSEERQLMMDSTRRRPQQHLNQSCHNVRTLCTFHIYQIWHVNQLRNGKIFNPFPPNVTGPLPGCAYITRNNTPATDRTSSIAVDLVAHRFRRTEAAYFCSPWITPIRKTAHFYCHFLANSVRCQLAKKYQKTCNKVTANTAGCDFLVHNLHQRNKHTVQWMIVKVWTQLCSSETSLAATEILFSAMIVYTWKSSSCTCRIRSRAIVRPFTSFWQKVPHPSYHCHISRLFLRQCMTIA